MSRPDGSDLRVILYSDVPYYFAMGWAFIATDPEDEATLAAWIAEYGL